MEDITSRGVSSKGLKIMIVAHSLGGMVARTAATLSNHPKCVVSDIIMLSSPNNKSPYTPDASMDKLFSSVNRAWLLSFYNTSKACQTSAVMAGLSGVYDQHSALSADYLCPVCAPQIRLTSISGGDIDLHVSPALTQLHEIASRPRNTSLEVVKQKGGMGVLGRVTQVKGLVTGLLSSVTVGVVKSVSGLFTSSNTTGVSEVVDEEVGVDTQCDAAFDGSCPVVVESDTNNTNANTTTYTRDITSKDKTEKEKTQFDFITPANWEAHILPYIEPQFLSVRTSQLKGVVTRGMETLSRVDSGDLSFDFANAFPVAGSSQSIVDSAVQAVKIINIDQLSRFVSRNESLHAFNLARVDESAYVVKILGGSALRALTVTNTPSVVTPLTFLEDSLGPRALLTATNITSSGGGSDGSASSSGNMFSAFHMSNIRSSTVTTCMHEDGGKYAVFEQIEATEAVTQVAKGVCLGPTYRVVHCACAKDVKLKFQSEWCEWCLCRKCGGKHLPVEKDVSRADTKDFSADLLLLAAFYGIVGITWMYALDRPYLCLYFIGLVAVAHFVVSLSKMMKIGV
eukprot:gene28991-35956_t